MSEKPPRWMRADVFVLDRSGGALFSGGRLVPITPQAFRALDLLVTNAGLVVTTEVIKRRLWPDVFVGESSVTQVVAHVRRALGENARAPRLIRTLYKRGYVFVGTVAPIDDRADAEARVCGPDGPCPDGT